MINVFLKMINMQEEDFNAVKMVNGPKNVSLHIVLMMHIILTNIKKNV